MDREPSDAGHSAPVRLQFQAKGHAHSMCLKVVKFIVSTDSHKKYSAAKPGPEKMDLHFQPSERALVAKSIQQFPVVYYKKLR